MKTDIKTLLFLTLATFINQKYISAENLNDCPLNTKSIIKEFFFIDSQIVNCSFISEIDELLLKVNKFSPALDLKINLFIKSKSNNASFDGGSILTFPQRLVFTYNLSDEYEAYLEANQAVIAHEYGHAIFDQRLSEDLEFRNYKSFSINKKLSELKLKLQDLNLSNSVKNKLERNIKDLDYELISSTIDTNFTILTLPYAELFADVISVYVFDDQRAVFNSLYYDEMSPRNFEFIKLRSFADDHTSAKESFLSEPHAMLAHVRYWIGQNLWPTSITEKKQMTELILSVLVKSIHDELKSSKKLNPIERNTLVIQNLKSRLDSNTN